MKNKYFILMLVTVLALIGCSKSDDDDPGDNGNDGFNEACNSLSYEGLNITADGDITSFMTPGSDPYNDYIECITECSQTAPNDPECMMDCLNSSGIMPSGGAFTIVLYITNITLVDITITIEPGTWFVPSSGDYQPMLVVISIPITIIAEQSIEVSIPVFCLAADKSAPDESSGYSMCDLVNSSCLSNITDILETKDFSAISYVELMQIQGIIWACTEGNTVDYEFLNDLPDL